MSKSLLRIVAALQIVLGLLYLLAPKWLLQKMGHSPIPDDLVYPLGMLAARFIAYGAGLWIAASAPAQHRLWIQLMAWIQLIDLMVGMLLTGQGKVTLSLSALPMFNALWIALLCAYLGRNQTEGAPA